MKANSLRCVIGILLLLCACLSQAEVYRCVDDTGQVIFTQERCAPHQESEKIDLNGMDTARKTSPAVCHEVRRLAEVIFPHVATTESVLDVYTNLGGREYLSAGITAAVNYVFNFRYNPKARQDEVVELTYAKCLDGGFGQITEKDLPNWDRIKYTKAKPEETEHAKTPDPQQLKKCKEYEGMIRTLTEKMEKAANKGERLQAQVDKEYYESLKTEQCSGHPQEATEKTPGAK